MLKLHWIEIFLRCIPEMLLIIWGIYIIAERSFKRRNYIILSIIMGLYSFLVRELPIYFGVHTIIITVTLISIMIIQGIPLITSIYSTLLMLLILITGESLNMLLLRLFNIRVVLNMDSVKKSILTFPSLIMVFLSVMIIQYIIKKVHSNICK